MPGVMGATLVSDDDAEASGDCWSAWGLHELFGDPGEDSIAPAA